MNELQNENKTLKPNVNELQNKNTILESNMNELQNDNKTLKSNVNELQNENKNLKSNMNELKSSFDLKIMNLTKELNKLMKTNYIIGQENIDIIHESHKIKERDNYRAIVYILLVSSGYSFEEIWKNLKIILENKSYNLTGELTNLLLNSSSLLKTYDKEGHDSTKKDILKTLYPNSYNNLRNKLNDNLLNETKELIAGIKNYINNNKEDKEFKNKLDNTANFIKFSI